MADALLDWVYHSNQTLPGTAVASLAATNRQLVQAVGGFGLCFFVNVNVATKTIGARELLGLVQGTPRARATRTMSALARSTTPLI